MILDIQKLINSIYFNEETFPLSYCFLNRDNKTMETAFEWLNSVDDSILDLLLKYSDKLLIFVEDGNSKIKDLDSTDLDYFTLAWLLTSFEQKKELNDVELKDQVEMVTMFSFLIVIESLKRKNLLKVSGNGKIDNILKNLKIETTDNGKIVCNGLSTLYKIVEKFNGQENMC